MWAAADDEWDLLWVETLLKVSISNNCLAFGKVASVDQNGNILKNLSNKKIFEYSGSRISRRVKYFIDPPLYGKANQFYGIYPRRMLDKSLVSVLTNYSEGNDILFLYALLKQNEIKYAGEVFLYKRIDFNAENVLKQKMNSKTVKFVQHLKSTLLSALFIDQFKLSNNIEKFIITTLYPLLLFRIIYSSIRQHIIDH